MYSIEFSRNAVREWKKLPQVIQKKIQVVFDGEFAHNPLHEHLDIKKLKTPFPGYRLRIGNYRVLFTITEDTQEITVYTLAHRKDVYK